MSLTLNSLHRFKMNLFLSSSMKSTVFITCLTLIIGCSQKKQESKTKDDEFDNKLTSIELITLDGKEINWSQMDGKVVFINFWATWCGPCIKEMPSIQNAQEQFSEKDIMFLLATEEGVTRIRDFKEARQFSLNLVIQKTPLATLNIVALPTTYIFDTEGNLAFQETSARQWDDPENIEMLQGIINKIN